MKLKDLVGQRIFLYILPYTILIYIFLYILFPGYNYPNLEVFFYLFPPILFLLWLLGINNGKILIPESKIFLWVVIFLLLNLINIYFSINKALSQKHFFILFGHLLIFFLIFQISLPNFLTLTIKVIFLLGFIVCIHGIYQYFYGFSYTLEYLKSLQLPLYDLNYATTFLKKKRIFACFFSPDMLASFLAMVISLSLGFLFETLKNDEKSKKKILIPISMTLLFMFTLFLTKSVGGFLSAFLVVIFFFTWFFTIKKAKYIVLFSIVLLFLFVSFILGPRFKEFFDFSLKTNSILQRWLDWQAGFKIIKDFFWLGCGSGTVGTIFPSYMSKITNPTKYLHNNYLQIWAELGILGCTSFFMILISFIRLGLKTWKKEVSGMEMGLFFAVSAFFFKSFLDYDYFVPQVVFLFWVILALFLKCKNSKLEFRFKLRKAKLIKIIFTIFLFYYIYTVSNFLFADYYFKKAKNLYFQGKYKEAGQEAGKAIRKNPDYDRYYGFLARIYLEKFNFKKDYNYIEYGIKALNKAIKLNPFYAFHYKEIAKYYNLIGKTDEAVFMLKEAIKHYPTNCNFIFELVRIYLEKNERENAKIYLDKILEIDPFNKEAILLIKKLP
jgi:O-antigen ligase